MPFHHPYLIGAAALLSTRSPVNNPDRTPYVPGSWVWPLPRWRGYAPVVSQEFHPGHNGVDLCYRRQSKGDRPEYVAGSHDGTIAFFAPPGVPVLAAHDGLLWSCDLHPSGRGWQIVLDHGAPWATYYLHMSAVNFPRTEQGAGGIHVRAGQSIGIMGYDPIDPQGFRHVHFETWYHGAGNSAVNPQAPPVPLDGIDHWNIIDAVVPPPLGATS